ncbi:MAG TPA: WbqC family protein, partial [Steroidobacteraceae bacterium]|nr:WbqC family protein [Steroidobacteraceae bacterium]
MRTIGIIQPCYLPWRGFFDFVNEVDTFVFLDDVQYTVRDWRSRNRIKTLERGCMWLSVPIQGGRDQLIKDVRIDHSQPWTRKHLGAMVESYGRCPFFEQYFGMLSSVL